MKISLIKALPYILIYIALQSASIFATLPLTTVTVNWIVDISFLLIVWRLQDKSQFVPLLKIYLVWISICIVRGFVIAENYWEYKFCIANSLALLMPIVMLLFSQPILLAHTLKKWFLYVIPIFIIWFIPFVSLGCIHFFWAPLFIVGLYFSKISNKYWKYTIVALLLCMLVVSAGARSQVIKAFVILGSGLGIIFFKRIHDSVLRFFHACFLVVPIILLVLGISGIFNVFKMDEYMNDWFGISELKKIDENTGREQDLLADTRTGAYVEVINSAINNHYILTGRTPARGNDSESFGGFMAKVLQTGKNERTKNEFCHPSVFTWTGLIGVVLFSLLYWQASFLAVYKSRNMYIKILGVFVAFRWCFGWVEDMIAFDMNTLSIWMAIAMCYSVQFRQMNDREFIEWINSIFSRKKWQVG